jgi:tetratricopeptide (TPR) repeat protein
LALWYYINYAVLERGTDLYAARWKHLEGDFEGQEDALNDAGARVRYMRLRHPEYELEDLQIDVELQKKYGLRRELGETEESYQRKVENMLVLFRQAKRAATFWLGLLHVEDSRWEPAATWMDERVLGDPAATRWHAAARYNLARVREQQGDLEEAIRLYKTNGDPQEHGNRLRARLIEYAAEKEPTPSS